MIPERRRYNVGVVKIPHAERDVAHRVMAADDRGFRDVIGADTHDDDEQFPVGAECTYSLELHPDEAQQFEDASNCRYIEPEVYAKPSYLSGGPPASTNGVPTDRTMTYLGCNFPRITEFNGNDIPVAILDQGTTAAVRARMAMTLVGRAILGETPPGELFEGADHGCMVAPNGVPFGGRILDGMVINADGRSPVSAFASGVRWACDNGAKVINYSFTGYQASQVYVDAFNYMSNFDCVLYAAAGNDSLAELGYPSAYTTQFPNNIAACVAFDEVTNTKASFSNYSSSATGCAPGVLVTSLYPEAGERLWSGTSAATPHMAQMCARLQTGRKVTSKQAFGMLNLHCRATGQPTQFQGRGAYDLYNSLIQPTPPPIGPSPLQVTSTALLTVL